MADINNNLNSDNFIVNDDELLNKKTNAIPKPTERKDIDTEKQFIHDLATAGVKGQVDMSTLNSFTHVSQSRNQVYDLIDSMAEDSTIAAILETYAEDATEYNDKGDIIWCESEDGSVAQFITYLLQTMQVNKNAYQWVYALCKYGDLYLQLYKESEFDVKLFVDKEKEKSKTLNEDIKINAYKENDKYVHYLEAASNPAEMFELTKFGKTVGYIKADLKYSNTKQDELTQFYYKYKFKKSDINVYDATKFVHAALIDGVDRYSEEVNLFLNDEDLENNNGTSFKVKRGQSLLYNVFKIWRELSLLENSMLLNRITKSSIVRLINVEVGDMPKEMVGPHLQGIKALMEQKSAINTGNSISEYTNPGPIENNIYVPVNNGKGTITTDQVGGDVNVSQIPDIEYFQNKFFGSMRIPKQYFGLTDDGAGFSGGESLAIISARYAKMVKRIQNALIQAITSVVNLMLIDKGLTTYIGKFTIKMQPPTTQEEIDRRDNMASKIQIVSDVMNLVSDIEDPATKLRILKSLLTDIIVDADVISEIESEIDKIEESAKNNGDNGDNSISNENDLSDNSFGGSHSSDLGNNDPLNLDDELGLNDGDELDSSDDNLPTPEELGVDMTDNNNPDLASDNLDV